MESDWFGKLEDAAFYGKFSEVIVKLILQELLKGRVFHQSYTEGGFADFGIEKFGLVEVTTSSHPTAPVGRIRKKWYTESRSSDVWVVVPDELVPKYLAKIDYNFANPRPKVGLPPEDAQRQRIHVVSLGELFSHLEKQLGIPNLSAMAIELTDSEKLSRLIRPLLNDWEHRFFGVNALS